MKKAFDLLMFYFILLPEVKVMSFKESVALAVGSVLLLWEGVSSQPLFAPPVNLGSDINTPMHESDPFLTADGKKLFFVRSSDIWCAEWNGTFWNPPINLGPQINSGPGIEHSPSVSPDGQKLFFVSDSRSGFLWDIWVSIFDSSIGDWGTPINLGWPVNTPGTEYSAHINSDGRRLFFSSISDSVDSLNPAGRCGIYMSEWNDTSWSIPLRQWGTCTPAYPSIPADGRWLYFDNFVSDGISVFAAAWKDSVWVLPAYDLRSQLGGRALTPFISPSGDSLFFTGCDDFPGFGGCDIWMSELVSVGVGDEPSGALPRAFELYQNHPNPFNSRTKISFFVSHTKNEAASLTVFNLLGFPVRHFIKNERIVGMREVEWDGTDDTGKEVASGIYFLKLRVGNEAEVKKAIFLK